MPAEHVTRAPRVVLADADDDRVRRAVVRIVADGAAEPVLVDPAAGAAIPDGVEVVRTDDPAWSQKCAAEYRSVLASKGRDPSEAEAAVSDPLLFAALYTRLGGADAGVAGNASTSPAVLRAALRGLGSPSADGLVAGAFLLRLPERTMTYADVSVIPSPDAGQLSEIAEMAADTHRLLTGDEPVVAMLSFSTRGSADHAEVDKVRLATTMTAQRRPDLRIDGELQFDVAVDPAVAAKKAPDSPVGGRANVLVFPNLDAANIAYKVTQRLGGVQAVGSFVLGLTKPWVDLSRGCSEDDIVDAVAVLADACREPQPA